MGTQGTSIRDCLIFKIIAVSWAPLDMDKTYRLVTNNYIAAGRDGYLTFKTVKNDGRYTDTYLDYAQSFVDYVQERGSVGKLPSSEYSTQALVN